MKRLRWVYRCICVLVLDNPSINAGTNNPKDQHILLDTPIFQQRPEVPE
jgi:hypothetical protein